MSYPGFINSLPIYGPPLPPALLLARRNATTDAKGSEPFQQRLTDKVGVAETQRSSKSPETRDEVKCSICNDLQLRKKGGNRNIPSSSKDISVHGLRVAALNGCPACRVLLNGITKSNVSLDDVQDIVLNTLRANSTLVMILTRGAAQEVNTYLEFYTKEDAPAAWSVFGPGRHVSLDSSSEDCFELARIWLYECLSKHSKCRPASNWKSPTRLLYIGSEGSDLKLVEAVDQSHKTNSIRYAALSHCWGPSKPTITETTSLDKRKAGILLSTLPKTFKDAVTVARKLDIHYLWIDSLCILQDSTEDWAREAEQMATVYANATLTIAADASPDAHGGLFVHGEGRSLPVSVGCSGPKGTQTFVYVRPQGIRRVANEVSHAYRVKGRSKLSTRGWTLQERLLSQRTLHFTENEMAWECSTCLRCECTLTAEVASDHCFKQRYIENTSVKDYAEMAGMGFSNSLEDTKGWKRRMKEKEEGAPILRLNWQHIVWEFTARQLTRPSDRLPALSGLAATMERATSTLFSTQSYAFGLWKRTIVQDLCWYTVQYDGSETGLNMPSRRQTEFYAPSWSWVSVTGRIKYDEDLEPTSEVVRRRGNYVSQLLFIDVQCNPTTGNRFGNAKDGKIVLAGYAAPVKIQTIDSETDSRQVNGEPAQTYLVTAKTRTKKGTTPYDLLDPDVKGDGYDIDLNDEHVVLLVAARARDGYCLVLKKLPRSACEYQRVGLIKTRYSSPDDWKDVGDELFTQGLIIR